MIKISQLKNQKALVRETTAPFTLIEKGVEKSIPVKIRYWAFSIAESDAYLAKLKKLGNKATWVDILVPLLESIPDLVDNNEQPVTITREFLSSLNTVNLQAIHSAISEDVNHPKSVPSESPTG